MMDALEEFEAFEELERAYASGVEAGREVTRLWFVDIDTEPYAVVVFSSANHALLDRVQGMVGRQRDGDKLAWVGKDILQWEIFKDHVRHQAVRRFLELMVSVVKAKTRTKRARAAAALRPYAHASNDGLLMGSWQ
jgi:hypothetical protein